MFHVIQSQERDLDYGLFEALAKALEREMDVTNADARHKVTHSYGILDVADEEVARRVSDDANALGIGNFILGDCELLSVPRAEPLRKLPVEYESIGLVAVGVIAKEVRRVEQHISLLSLKFAGPRIPIPGSMVEEVVRRETYTRFHLDIIALMRDRHYRLTQEAISDKVSDWLKGIQDRRDHIYISRDAEKILEGRRNVRRFPEESHYERYLKWLVQIRYARPYTGYPG